MRQSKGERWVGGRRGRLRKDRADETMFSSLDTTTRRGWWSFQAFR